MSCLMDALGGSGEEFPEKELTTGTTTMAVEFNGGVVVGADSRTTSGHYVSNRFTDKIEEITENVYACRSGSSADSQYVLSKVIYHLKLLRMELKEPVNVKTAANTVRQLCYSGREFLFTSMIVSGWDRKLGGQVYCVPIGGMITREPVTVGGSGSRYIYGFVDENYKRGMSKDSCVSFVVKAISQAIWRDGSSGGVIRVATITEKGAERMLFMGEQVPKYYINKSNAY